MKVRIWTTTGGYQKMTGITSVGRLEDFYKAEYNVEGPGVFTIESALFVSMNANILAMQIEHEEEEDDEDEGQE